MRKRLLTLLAAMCILSLPLSASAAVCQNSAVGGTFGDFDYELLDSGTVCVTCYRGSAQSVDIPSNINGSAVTEIGRGAFAACSTLKSVSIPDTVTKIGSSAFAVCEALTSVNIPKSVSYIDSDAFYLTPWLENHPDDIVVAGNGILVKYKGTAKSVVIPDTVRVIGYGAFSDSPQVESVIIPDSVRIIDNLAFYGTKLEQAVIPPSVTRIGDMAFCRCTDLTSVTIPSTVREIGTEAFYSSEKVIVKCRKNSAAEKYCKDNNIRYESSDGEDVPPSSDMMGDVDGDGDLTANDALLVLRVSAELEKFSATQAVIADIDNDGNITSSDALEILRMSVGL